MRYWLFKSEPTSFSIDDLRLRPRQREHWDGVRNFQARNMLRDEIKTEDAVLFYHSSCQPPGVAGIAKVVKNGYPDHTAWDMRSSHYDPRSSPEKPIWYMVDIEFVEKFSSLITLEEIKKQPRLKNMLINRKGNRLSITPLTPEEWRVIVAMAAKKAG